MDFKKICEEVIEDKSLSKIDVKDIDLNLIVEAQLCEMVDLINEAAIRKKAFFIQKPGEQTYDNTKIRSFLRDNVLEVVFKRRIWPVKKATYQKSQFRRMLCTANWQFIKDNSALFQWKPPKFGRPKEWYIKRNLAIIWDLIVKHWRMVSLDEYDIINMYPIKTKEQQEKYIAYYKNLLKREGRIKLMDKFNN